MLSEVHFCPSSVSSTESAPDDKFRRPRVKLIQTICLGEEEGS